MKPIQHLLAVGGLFVLLSTPAAHAQVVAQKDRFGDAMRIGLPLAAGALTFYRDDTEGLKQLGLSLGAAAVATEVLKRGIDSKRPDGSGHGFPSGHASMAFTAAAYVHRRYSSLEWALPMYGLATLAAYERVHKNQHFTKDVVGGALVGVASAWAFTGPYTVPRSAASIGYHDKTVTVGYVTTW